MLALKLLFLLLVANGAPILLTKALGPRFAWPVDGGRLCPDGRPFLGRSKTWRGLLAAILATGPAAVLVGLPLGLGLWFGALAMFGDMFSSWLKRRLAVPSSGKALGLDQVPEALFPLLGVRSELELQFIDIVWLTLLFLFLELVLSRVLYLLHIRAQPH